MDRSAVKAHARRECNIEQIAGLMRMERKTVKKTLEGLVDPAPQPRERKSQVNAFRDQIVAWIGGKVPVKRMLKLAQELEQTSLARMGPSVFYTPVKSKSRAAMISERA